MASSILLARGLGPAGLGLLNVLATVIFIASTVTDFGLTNAGVSRLAQIWSSDKPRAGSTVRALVILKIILAGLFVVPVLVYAESLVHLVFETDNGAVLLQIAFIGVFVRAIGGGFAAILQAAQVQAISHFSDR
jgi:O-antigen/teichoic acid export membrane protein